MKRTIVLKFEESKNSIFDQFEISVNMSQFRNIIWEMMEQKTFTKTNAYNIIMKSNDVILVSTILSEYEHNIRISNLMKLLKKFPKSEMLQRDMVTYCVANHKPDMLHYLMENGISKTVREEAKEGIIDIF